MYLAEQALEMLKGTRYWFSQLTLIQALCLLNISDGPKHPGDKHGAKAGMTRSSSALAGRRRPRARADRDQRAGAPAGPHPFVREASELAVLALKTGRPQRYCWIDESGVVAQVGSRNTPASRPRQRNRQLWIPPSAGWTALNGRAQRLVADVLPAAEPGRAGLTSHANASGVSSARTGPTCRRASLRASRAIALRPGRTTSGTATSSAPRNDLRGRLWVREIYPYPPKGVQPRVEMTEASSAMPATDPPDPAFPRPPQGSLAEDGTSAAHCVPGPRWPTSRPWPASPGRGDRSQPRPVTAHAASQPGSQLVDLAPRWPRVDAVLNDHRRRHRDFIVACRGIDGA